MLRKHSKAEGSEVTFLGLQFTAYGHAGKDQQHCYQHCVLYLDLRGNTEKHYLWEHHQMIINAGQLFPLLSWRHPDVDVDV